MTLKFKNFFFVLFFLHGILGNAQAMNYCTSLRGNGLRMAGHWGAMARLVEQYGLPRVMAGGSSGSVSMLIFSSLKIYNPHHSNEQYAFLIKTFPHFLRYYTLQENFIVAKKLVDSNSIYAKKLKELTAFNKQAEAKGGLAEIFAKIALYAKIQTSPKFRDLYKLSKNSLIKLLINSRYEDQVKEVEEWLKNSSGENRKYYQNLLNFRKSEQEDSLTTLGSFNTENDHNFLFREGLISYDGLAEFWGWMANFYAGYGMSNEMRSELQNIIWSCSENSINKTSRSIFTRKPKCKKRFYKLVDSYLDLIQKWRKGEVYIDSKGRYFYKKNHFEKVFIPSMKWRVSDDLGRGIKSYVITSTIQGKGAKLLEQMNKDYRWTTNKKFGQKFKIKKSDFNIAYWGDESLRKAISKTKSQAIQGYFGDKLDFTNDFKANLSQYHGMINWFGALRASTAEPGQSKAVEMNYSDGSKLYSTGGWADNLPTHFLRANPECEVVISLTKSDGIGRFGQEILNSIRGLNGFKRKYLDAETRNLGVSSDFQSEWSRRYNIANPNSSFNMSTKAADALLCSTWDFHNPQKESMDVLFESGFYSPFYIRPAARFTNTPLWNRAHNLNYMDEDTQTYSSVNGFSHLSGCLHLAQ